MTDLTVFLGQPCSICCHAGRILNIAVCAADTNEPPRLLNYLTAPNVVVWSAVACSSAFPGLFQPQDLLAKDHNGNFVRWVPGGHGAMFHSYILTSLMVCNFIPFLGVMAQ